MPQPLKAKTCIITLILLISLLNIIILGSPDVNAQEDFDETVSIKNDILIPDPFEYVAFYKYYEENETRIQGDMVFELFFTSTLNTKLDFLFGDDAVNLSVYHSDIEGETSKIEVGSYQINLDPQFLEGNIQKTIVTLEDIDVNLTTGDSLSFYLDMTPSEKKIGRIVEENYNLVVKGTLQRLANWLGTRDNPQLNNLSETIDYMLETIDEFGISPEEIAELANALRSASFVYASSDYPSSVRFPIDPGENLTLYFYNENIVDTTAPNETIEYFYPPVLLSKDEFALGTSTEEWIVWFGYWSLTVLGDDDYQDTDNRITYYLHSDNKMDESVPESTTRSEKKLSQGAALWESDPIPRNIIIENFSAEVYLYFPKLITSSSKIKAEILDDNETIASEEVTLEKAKLAEFIFGGPAKPKVFTFDDFETNREIWNGNKLKLRITLIDKPIFSILRSPKVYFDSNEYSSFISYKYRETENIKIQKMDDKKTIPGGNSVFTLEIDSKYDDTLDIVVDPYRNIGGWTVEYDETLDVTANTTTFVPVYVNSTSNDNSSYDNDVIKMFFNISGSTGINSTTAGVEVDESAVDFNIEVLSPSDKKVKHGSKYTYQFKIRNNNTGYLDDNYLINVSSENDWLLYNGNSVSYYNLFIKDIGVYNEELENERIVNVTIEVPWYTDISEDKLTFKISSDNSQFYAELLTVTVNVTTDVIEPGVFEGIYHVFENAAKSIGFNNVFGSYATWALIFLLLLLIIIIIVILIIFIRKNYIELICLERIKNIEPNEIATFEIDVYNPYKKTLTYDLKINSKEDLTRWNVNLDVQRIVVEPKQKRKILLSVQPTDYVKPNDWVEVGINAKSVGKRKSDHLSTVTVLKESQVHLEIQNVFHWPRIFKKNDRVTTSFKLKNNGNVAVNNITISLYINGEEKNKVEGVNIPRGGYADIEIPWIAKKGKNEVYILVK